MLGDCSYLSEKYAGEGCGRETRKKGKKSRDVSALERTCLYLGGQGQRDPRSDAWASETLGAAGSGRLGPVTRKAFIPWHQITTRKLLMLQGDKIVKLFRTFHLYTKALLKYIPQTITSVIKGERNLKEPFSNTTRYLRLISAKPSLENGV